MIIKENNYKKMELIPYVENPSKTPDFILYPDIFNSNAVKQIMEVLKSVQFNKNNQAWFTDDPKWIFDKKLSPQPFPNFIDNIRNDIEKVTGRKFNSCLVTTTWSYKKNKLLGSDFIIPSLYIGNIEKIEIKSKNNNTVKQITVSPGSLLIKRESFVDNWVITANSNNIDYVLKFFRIYPPEYIQPECKDVILTKIKLPYNLSIVYLKTKYRIALSKSIKKGLADIHSVPEGLQCIMKNGINHISKYIKLKKLIGTGDWGNVYSACLSSDFKCRRKFAIKMSRITQEDYKEPYTETSTAWYESLMLKDIIKPLITKNICPNLPLFIDTFLCNKCDFIFRKGDTQHPCVITIMELASSDMTNFLKFGNPTDNEVYSALFQIMAGIHAIQISGQILNNDIKTKNILVYNVKPGGYWHYKIFKNNFYVPNYGKMFVINDFGVSTLYNPNFQLYPNKRKTVFNLGSRFAINIDGMFSPIETNVEYESNRLRKSKTVKWLDTDNSVHRNSRGANYKLDRKTGQIVNSRTELTPVQKSYLFRKGVTTNPKTWDFFSYPHIIPPFEFYNDVQDALRMFVGGKRTTQRGDHILYPIISKQVQNNINPYLGKSENSKKREFSMHAYHVLAGEFITKFFTETHSYRERPKGKKLGYYDMNKCL